MTITPQENFYLLVLGNVLILLLLWKSRRWSTPMVLVALDSLRSQMGGLAKEIHAVRAESAAAAARVSHYDDRLRHVEHRTAQLSVEIGRFPCADCPAVKNGIELPGAKNHDKENDDA